MPQEEIEEELRQSKSIGAERFILYKDQVYVGIIEYLLHNHGDQCTWLGLLLIRNDLQSMGYGSEVLRQFEELMTSKEIKKYRIGVIVDNEPAHRFWNKQGFVRVASSINGDNKEIVIYEKTI
ncbi:GNAT family N-acetyltransferase [Xylanibacillus composti]|uniref:GNAT family N-acetyltransferase n=1 Tax=Xylanibacillus composti TaxID=1572762 RepID=UPI002458CC8E|nr:GNAT family N-acetyltransferase [Xylanibacillus composti]